jgi:nucleoside 2-deoxyribosyltransferase
MARARVGVTLTRSERIQLMREIATRLATEDYSLIDLTLTQFSLPVADTWSDSKNAYVLRMIERADDGSLVELGQHVGVNVDARADGIDPPFWRKGMFRLFLSHLAAHRSSAAQLQEAALQFGISCFVAHNDIEPTQEWQTQIETALATCDAVVALLHPNFHKSNWTDQELGFGMGRGVPVIAIRLGEDPYGFIGRFQAFNGQRKSALTLAKEVFDSFRKSKQTQKRMGEVLIGLFEESGSFATAKTRVGYLEELTTWDKSYISRIRAAVKNNSQISGSWGVPQRAEILAKKWAKT